MKVVIKKVVVFIAALAFGSSAFATTAVVMDLVLGESTREDVEQQYTLTDGESFFERGHGAVISADQVPLTGLVGAWLHFNENDVLEFVRMAIEGKVEQFNEIQAALSKRYEVVDEGEYWALFRFKSGSVELYVDEWGLIAVNYYEDSALEHAKDLDAKRKQREAALF